MTLFILAAGMGSRYGGLKQIDPFTKHGEFIIDFSIYDAIKAGFNKVVFVIKEENYEAFKETVGHRIEKKVDVEYVFQKLDSFVPADKLLPERVKPWGTTQALLCAKDALKEGFAVINADDFYGRDSFAVLGKALTEMTGKKNDYCMVGYRVGNTLSESGSVARGVCETNAEGYLTGVVERTAIERIDGDIQFIDENGKKVVLEENTPVSMNMWGFTPDYFAYSEEFFKDFLKKNMDNLKSEYFIPLMVNELITNGTARVKVWDTTSKWFGVTYAADRQGVVDKIQALVDAGEYPEKLF